jgi:heme-degrading monooxygenase HmoA
MGEVYATGSWKPIAGQEEAFLAEWREFMAWACSLPGARRAVLARDLRDPERFVSFSGWESLEAVKAWKSSPEFKPRMSRVQAHIDKFAPTELEIVAVAGE